MNNDQSVSIYRSLSPEFSRRDEIISGLVFAAVTLLIIFSVEFPIELGISEYESINTEDFAVVFLLLWFAKRVLLGEERAVGPLLPTVTAMLIIVTGWIVLTFGIAAIRSPSPVAASALWVMKWFEVVLFFICIQHLMRPYSASVVIKSIVAGGALLAGYSVYASQLLAVRRVRVFFNNPNTLAAFFILVITLSIGGAIANRGLPRYGYSLAGILTGGAMLTTLSRSGMIGLIVAMSLLVVLHYRDLTGRALAGLVGAVVTVGWAMAYMLQDRLDRFVEWVRISPDGVALASGTAAESFRIRLELLRKSFDLWIEQPIFGYGWFASPSRVGFLDNFYSILIVELGLPGLILMLGLYAAVLRSLIQAGIRGSSHLSNAVVAWFIGLLAMSIGGAFARSPQMMMLWTLLLVAVWIASEGGFWEDWNPA
ncbi:O-antigen ligase family protein [Salinarchaeum chitinilyticum]